MRAGLLCAAVTDAGIGEALGIEGPVEVRTGNHAECMVGDSWDLNLAFGTVMPPAPAVDAAETEIGGRAALSADEGCRLWVDLGENPVLAELVDGGRDGLDCSALPATLEPLVS
ncbi:hypothetical protein GCM10028820_32250 [Tessaracoccus terricola]